MERRGRQSNGEEMIVIIIITIIFLEPRREGFVYILKAALLRKEKGVYFLSV